MWHHVGVRLVLLGLALVLNPLPSKPGQADEPPKPKVGEGLQRERDLLSQYQWRLKTEMKVDDHLRLMKLEEVHLGPDGKAVRRTLRYERKPTPTPVPFGDPRAPFENPTTEKEDDRFFDLAQDLMDIYASLPRERLEAWATSAKLLPPDPDRAGQIPMEGRGLGRPQDDARLYLDAKTRVPREIEVKTTVDPKIVDLAFLRVTFEQLQGTRPGVEPPLIPKRIFLNMNRNRHRVALEMETMDYRSWP